MDSKKAVLKSNSIFGATKMKKSESVLALEELFASHEEINHQNKPHILGSSDQHAFLPTDNVHFPFKNSVSLFLLFIFIVCLHHV